MTKKERAIVLKAAELIASGAHYVSCLALDYALDETCMCLDHPLILAYKHFYKSWDRHDSVGHGCLDGEDPREVRVLMLLTFAEVG